MIVLVNFHMMDAHILVELVVFNDSGWYVFGKALRANYMVI